MSERFEQIHGLDEAWKESSPGERVKKLRRAAQEVRERLVAEGPVQALATVKLVTFPYPTVFAFSGGARSPAPYVMMTNAMNVVQFEEDGRLKTLLFNPSDYERNKQASFYVNLRKRYGEFLSNKVFPTFYGQVPEQLKKLGLEPEDVDYIAWDHLHVQDIRGWLGGDGPAYFPNAKLIVQRQEWRSVNDLHPMNAIWYVPGGVSGVAAERVIEIEGDVKLGRGVALISTPGHTFGNMSLMVTTPNGPFLISENAVAAECYTPLLSSIPGVRGFAEQMGYEVVLNGNTRDCSLDQYSSMIVEKVLAGPSKADPSFINFFPSSQLTASILAPGLSPTFVHAPPECGALRRPAARAAA
jgi:glyoxylase-like metal-dependent hydrolase (beta-lactamase superfamily II)